MARTFWKCTVCGDIHWGDAGPETCPTCHAESSYEQIDNLAARKALGF